MEKANHLSQYNKPVEAYNVMLYLVSHKSGQFTDIQTLCFWDQWKMAEAIRVMAHINHRLLELSKKWSEDIPHINAFMFDRNGMCTTYICQHIFKLPEGVQPTARQIAEYAKAIYTYPKWDEVLEVFRQEAFEAKNNNS